MCPSSSTPAGARIAFRCDGDAVIGAGHVARCLPLACAFARLGRPVEFVGAFDGIAGWLLSRAGVDTEPPDDAAPCGVSRSAFGAAVVDSYEIPPEEICELAGALPLATLAEANRCGVAGILLDYHLDRSEQQDERLLAGAQFAPLDPAFAGAGRAAAQVERVLLTLGGSRAAYALLEQMVPAVSAAFEGATVLVAGAGEQHARLPGARVLPSPSALVEIVGAVDVAVTAAGFTAYELACAGIPQVVIGIVENQRRVIEGFRRCGLAPCLDLTAGDTPQDLPAALEQLRDAGSRRRLSQRGMAVLDGKGAERAAAALLERFELPRGQQAAPAPQPQA